MAFAHLSCQPGPIIILIGSEGRWFPVIILNRRQPREKRNNEEIIGAKTVIWFTLQPTLKFVFHNFHAAAFTSSLSSECKYRDIIVLLSRNESFWMTWMVICINIRDGACLKYFNVFSSLRRYYFPKQD